jgi:hypothetical protein
VTASVLHVSCVNVWMRDKIKAPPDEKMGVGHLIARRRLNLASQPLSAVLDIP